jgi:hypothetical protein
MSYGKRNQREGPLPARSGRTIQIYHPSFTSWYPEWKNREKQLTEALQTMIGWAKCAVECDPHYFSEKHAPNWKEDLAKAESVLANAEKQ